MDVTFRDRAVYVEETLVVADLHVGKGDTATSGLSLPIGDSSDMLERFERLLDEFGPDRVIVAGDFLHSFETVPVTVERSIDGFLDRATKAGAEIVVTPGNHDVLLESVWQGETNDSVRVGEALVCHGHETPSGEAPAYVVGHDHPTITIEGQRRPCYLRGPAPDGGRVLMLPAFNRLLRGVEVNGMTAGDFQCPLVTDAGALEPVVWDDDAETALEFPPLDEFGDML